MVVVEWLLSHPPYNYLILLLLLIDWPSLKATSILPFQKPPQPLVVWPANVPEQQVLQRLINWEDKHFGQWCRNVTIDRHTQCPEASPFHWFVCCGEDGVECCRGIQTWAYVVFGSVILSVLIILTFYLLLHFHLICGPEEADKREDSPCTLLSSSSSPASPCSHSPSSNSSKPNSLSVKDSNSCLSSLVVDVVVEDYNREHT